MSSDHYFSSQPSSEMVVKPFRAVLAGRERELVSAGGVFSPGELDMGTRVLLRTVPPPPVSGHLLDLGCGWGPIALSLALASPDATVWAVDVNERARELTRRNATLCGTTNINAVHPDDVPADIDFEAIWSNPPIRVGKDELHALLTAWLPRLSPGSDAWLVVARHLGAESLQRWLETQHGDQLSVTRAENSKGFRVLRATRRS
jgi:16S rRNA (guanine1207-N2)-methyltransferase